MMTMTVGDSVSKSSSDSEQQQHKRIEGQLQSLLASLQKREPLDASYDALLPVSFRKHAKASVTITSKASLPKSQSSSSSTPNTPGPGGGDGIGHRSKQDQPTNQTTTHKKSNSAIATSTADVKLHRRLNANLRGIVEKYASTPAGWRRKPNTRRIDIDFGCSSQSDQKGGGVGGNSTVVAPPPASTSSSAARNDNHDEKKIDTKLRAAFALRETKEHEQRDLVNATLKAENSKLYRGWGYTPAVTGAGVMMGGVLPPFEEASNRKKRLDGIAKQLRDREKCAAERARWTKIAERGRELILNPESTAIAIMSELPPPSPPHIPIKKATPDKSSSSRGRGGKKRKLALDVNAVDPERERLDEIEEARKREKILRERLEREEAENKRQMEKEREERERRERALETPRDALKRLCEPIFTALWDMEFAELGNTNPFRMVIDASTCAAMGVPDYCDVIKKPMNLTYIQTKLNNKSYEALQEFMEDMNLIGNNAMQYNSDPNNPYHIAAREFRRKLRKLAKPLIQSLTKGMATAEK